MSVETSGLAAYIALAVGVTLTPGPNMALVIRTALEADAAAGIRATLGVACGLAAWALASAVGVAAVLEALPAAFSVLQAGGGIWLIFLGIRAVVRSRNASAGTAEPPPAQRDFPAGLVTNLLNPFVGAFYLAALPGFVRPGPTAPLTTLVLAAIHIAMVMAWLSLCSVLVERGAALLTTPRARQLLQRASAVVLIGFGIRVLATVFV